MSAEAWIGIVAIVVTVLIALAGALISHIRHDEKRHAENDKRLQSVEQEIGTHDSGIRGEMHRQVQILGNLRAVIYYLGRKLKLEVMKDLDDDT